MSDVDHSFIMIKIKEDLFMDFKARLKNIYFWMGVAATVLLAAGVDWQTLTSWPLLIQAFISIVQNPVAIVSGVIAFIGIAVDTSTKGLKDKNL